MLFCDLVNSTPLSRRLDPEQVRDIIRVYRDRCAGIIEANEGTVSSYAGDGISAYFGYPRTHESTPDCAIRSALEITRVIPQIRLYDEDLQVRVGIATGVVVVGDLIGKDAREERSVIGEAPNLAARLQALADPGTVLISHGTRVLLGELYQYADLGEQQIKGFEDTQRVWRVVGRSQAESRFEALRGPSLTPFGGRDEEIRQLLDAWRSAASGRGSIVLLEGDAGIGKSRLVRELKRLIAAERHTRFTCQGWLHHQNSAFYSVIELIQRIFDVREQDPKKRRFKRLEEALDQRSLSRAKLMPVLAPFLGLDMPPQYPALRLSPEGMKQKTQEALVDLILSAAAENPVLLVVEDAHWLDPSTVELLGQLIGHFSDQPILLVISTRPGFAPPWNLSAPPLRIEIGPLPRGEVRAMVGNIAGGRSLPGEVLDQISRRADGVPLYVEELTRLLLNSDVLIEAADGFRVREGHDSGDAIPERLQDLLLARMNGLSHERYIAYLGAVLGRDFEYSLIRAIWQEEEDLLCDGLDRLVKIGLLIELRSDSDCSYQFRHALIQDAAYNALLIAERRELHEQVALTLEKKFPLIGESRPEILARHFAGAGEVGKAISYWLSAGRRCSERSENLEAVAHLRKALNLVNELPEGPQRLGTELELVIALSSPLVRTRGYGSLDVEASLTRAREICNALREAPQLPFVLIGLAIFHTSRADLDIARELTEQVSTMNKAGEPTLDMMIHRSFASTLFWQGQLTQARDSAERGIALYHRERHHALASRYFVDPGVVCFATLGLVQWLLGHADKAVTAAREGILLGRALSHPFSLGFALVYAASVHQMLDDHQATIDLADENTSISTEHAFPMGLAWAAIVRGWSRFQQSRRPEALTEVSDGIALWQKTGTNLIQPYFLSLLADLQCARGESEAGLATISAALGMAERTGEVWWQPELYRRRGELKLLDARKYGLVDAEADFRRALQLARSMRAAALEQRAVQSLLHLHGGTAHPTADDELRLTAAGAS